MQKDIQKVKDLMTTKVVTMEPDRPFIEAANILVQHNWNGLPVVDGQGKLLGIITEYDLILKGTSIHLPTLLNLLKNMHIYKKDTEGISQDIKKILEMKVRDVMNPNPFTISPESSIEEAVWVFTQHEHLNPIPVVDGRHKLVGLLARFDIIKMFNSPSVSLAASQTAANVEANVKKFISDFEGNFVVVNKTRVRWWLLASLLFALIGFIVAFMIMLRISV